MRILAGSLQEHEGWSPWSNLTSPPASRYSLASATLHSRDPRVSCNCQVHNSSTSDYQPAPSPYVSLSLLHIPSAALCKCFSANGRKSSRTCPTTGLSTSKMPSLGQCSAIFIDIGARQAPK